MQKNEKIKSESAISFLDVSVQLGKSKVLQNISLAIPTKTITGILGPNGAGKSTLLSLVTGLRKQTAGKIIVLGEQLPTKNEKLRQKIGVVFQETSLYEELTIKENLEFTASLYSVENPKQRIAEVLALLGLSDRVNDLVRILSGGLKRRTAIARALLHDPELLVVDEPTLGVDVETRHDIWSHLKLLRSRGHTIIIATNYLDEAQAICDSVSILHKGKLVVTDSPQRLIAKTGHSLDVECTSGAAKKIATAVKNKSGIIRSEITPSGISIFLQGDVIPNTIVNTVLKTKPGISFRFRPADLAEVFRALDLRHDPSEKNIVAYEQNFFTRHPVFMTIFFVMVLGGILMAEIWFSQPQ